MVQFSGSKLLTFYSHRHSCSQLECVTCLVLPLQVLLVLPLLFTLKIEAQTSIAACVLKRVSSAKLSPDKDGEDKPYPLHLRHLSFLDLKDSKPFSATHTFPSSQFMFFLYVMQSLLKCHLNRKRKLKSSREAKFYRKHK